MLNRLANAKRILIVDDESTLVFFLKQGLQEIEDTCRIDAAPSGEDALTKLTYNKYDLLVTDLKMPGISGFTLVEIARSLHPHIKVILMTAFGSKEVQNEVKNLQVDGYLTKPFPTTQFQDMVTNILASKTSNSNSTVSNQSIPVDSEIQKPQNAP